MIADIDALVDQAGVHAIVFGKHRKLAQLFPFGIYYAVDGNQVLVHAVLDLRRDPGRNAARLGE